MKIFIGGPRAISKLNNSVEEKLNGMIIKGHTILVGDANGIDRAVQQYFQNQRYERVVVYASNGTVRNNLGKWPVEAIQVADNIRGFDFYATKDKAMVSNADYGFMVWNGESKGTFTNIINLLAADKKLLLYFSQMNAFLSIDCFEKLECLLEHCSDNIRRLYETVYSNPAREQAQMRLFESTELM